MPELFDDIPDAELDALLNEPILDDEGNVIPAVTPTIEEKPIVKTETIVAPTELKIPPELLAQGGALAAQVQAFLNGNAATQKAILDKLTGPAPVHETAEERSARAQKLFNDFVLDPEKTLDEYNKKRTPEARSGLSDAEKLAIQAPMFQEAGERRVGDFLREMRENDELGLDAEIIKAIESDFHEFTAAQGKKFGSYEQYIGSISKDEARETLENVYMRSLGKKIAADTREARKTQSTVSIAGKGAGGESGLKGVSPVQLEIAKKTAMGLATGDDGKVDAAQYKEYLRLAIGR